MINLSISIAIIVGVVLLLELGRLKYCEWQYFRLIRKTMLHRYDPLGASLHLGIFGDSVGGGTGASHPDHSIAGLLAKEFPHIRVTNKSVISGVGLHKLHEILKKEPETYDLVILFVGGNDVIRLTKSGDYPSLLRNLYAEAGRIGTHIVHVSPANVGLAPIFRIPLNYFYQERSRVFRRVAQQVAEKEGVCYVDMFYEKHEDPFQQRRSYYATDLSHPSDAGYRIWAARIAEKLKPLIDKNDNIENTHI